MAHPKHGIKKHSSRSAGLKRGRARRTRWSPEQLQRMISYFEDVDSKPSHVQIMEDLANNDELFAGKIQIWFQNRRASEKKRSKEMTYKSGASVIEQSSSLTFPLQAPISASPNEHHQPTAIRKPKHSSMSQKRGSVHEEDEEVGQKGNPKLLFSSTEIKPKRQTSTTAQLSVNSHVLPTPHLSSPRINSKDCSQEAEHFDHYILSPLYPACPLQSAPYAQPGRTATGLSSAFEPTWRHPALALNQRPFHVSHSNFVQVSSSMTCSADTEMTYKKDEHPWPTGSLNAPRCLLFETGILAKPDIQPSGQKDWFSSVRAFNPVNTFSKSIISACLPQSFESPSSQCPCVNCSEKSHHYGSVVAGPRTRNYMPPIFRLRSAESDPVLQSQCLQWTLH